jgi:uncharacterized protein YfiM (DUF2279 family)
LEKIVQKKIIIAAIAALTSMAHADEWTGRDKSLHFIAGAAVGAAVTVATERRDYGIAAGVAVGLAKEIYDSQHRDRHTPSVKDFAVTAAGAVVGAYVVGLIVGPRFIGYATTF